MRCEQANSAARIFFVSIPKRRVRRKIFRTHSSGLIVRKLTQYTSGLRSRCRSARHR